MSQASMLSPPSHHRVDGTSFKPKIPLPPPTDTPLVGLQRYQKMEKLGEGAYGKVYLAWDHLQRRWIALKKIKLGGDDEGVNPTTLREISILLEVKHNNVVDLLDLFHDQADQLYLVFEFVDHDMKQYMDKQFKHSERRMDSHLVKQFMYQLLQGLAHIHSHRILHRDLKPQNLLISSDGVLKLADFGLARAFGLPVVTLTHEVITLWYRAPEILLGGKHYSTGVDIWSAACIFIEMLSGKPIFPGDSEIGQLVQVFQILGTPNETLWPGVTKLQDWKPSFPKWGPRPLSEHIDILENDRLACDLISRMLVYDPARRIAAKDALAHAYFDDLRGSVAISSPRKRGKTFVNLN